jgi:hypothetical protein
MKKQILRTVYSLLAILIVAGITFSSCKKDSTSTPVVKTVLADSLAAAKALLNGATEGVAAGQYQAGSKATLQSSIDAVQLIYDDPKSTQAEINSALSNLEAAVLLFKTKAIVPIAQANLIAQWTFSEGSGTTVADASANHLNGTLMAGHSVIVGRGPIPTWTTDRYGNAGKALHFSYGGHIEVPYQSILVPTQITISLWFQIDSLNLSDNYVISEDWWYGYKLNFQTATKAFFTYYDGTNPHDKDWDVNGITDHSWHYLAVTYTSGAETYYLDGFQVKSWTDVTGNISVKNPQTFAIGQAQPNTITGVLPADDPSQWGVGYFRGSLDDIRMYNIALTAVQIQGIYDLEKVPAK